MSARTCCCCLLYQLLPTLLQSCRHRRSQRLRCHLGLVPPPGSCNTIRSGTKSFGPALLRGFTGYFSKCLLGALFLQDLLASCSSPAIVCRYTAKSGQMLSIPDTSSLAEINVSATLQLRHRTTTARSYQSATARTAAAERRAALLHQAISLWINDAQWGSTVTPCISS